MMQESFALASYLTGAGPESSYNRGSSGPHTLNRSGWMVLFDEWVCLKDLGKDSSEGGTSVSVSKTANCSPNYSRKERSGISTPLEKVGSESPKSAVDFIAHSEVYLKFD